MGETAKIERKVQDQARLSELDSVRGLMCLTVVFAHHLYVYPQICETSYHSRWLDLIKFTPLRIFYAGHESLVMFFIMSGFVLSLPFFDKVRRPNYMKFVIRRIFRIYPPYLVAVIVGAIAYSFCFHGKIQTLSNVVTDYWWHWVRVQPNLLASINLMGFFDCRAFDPVVWSLTHEMRIFLVFPILMFIVLSLDAALVVPASFFALFLSMPYVDFVEPLSLSRTYSLIPFFMLGGYLAKHKDWLVGVVNRMPRALQFATMLLVMLVYPYRWLFIHYPILHTQFMDSFIPAIFGSVIIIFALASLPALSFLRRRELVYLGEISYSIYLYHVIVLLVLLYSFYGKIPLPVILITSLFLGFPIAAFAQRFVELPSVALGHKLSNLFQSRPKVPPTAPPPAVPEKELVGTR